MKGEFIGAMNLITFSIVLILFISFLFWKGGSFVSLFLITLLILVICIGIIIYIAGKIGDRGRRWWKLTDYIGYRCIYTYMSWTFGNKDDLRADGLVYSWHKENQSKSKQSCENWSSLPIDNKSLNIT